MRRLNLIIDQFAIYIVKEGKRFKIQVKDLIFLYKRRKDCIIGRNFIQVDLQFQILQNQIDDDD